MMRRVKIELEVETDQPLDQLEKISNSIDDDDPDLVARGITLTFWENYDEYDDIKINSAKATEIDP